MCVDTEQARCKVHFAFVSVMVLGDGPGGKDMRRGVVNVFLAVAAFVVLLPAIARAQNGQIAGSVRDSSDALIPGVTVEVASPALIEKTRSTVTDNNGQY